MQYSVKKRVGISTIGILLNRKDVSLVKEFGADEVEFVMEFNEKGIIDGAFEKSLHASHHYTNLAALNDSALEFSKNEVSKLFHFELPVVVHEGRSITNFDGWKEKSFKRMEKTLLELSEAGNILLENITPSSYFKDITEFFAFVSANNLNVCLDFSHVFANEGTLKNVFTLKDAYKERIKKFHISGTVPFKDRHFPIKEGALPLSEIKAFLKEFSVPLINEAVFRVGDIVEFYRNEIKLTREIYG
jgi:endonuclease IV